VSRTEIRITGFGGQGVVLSGYIIGRACSIHSNLHATMIQSFGPEARGSACSATLTVQDSEVLYPYIGTPTILVALTGEAYEKYREELSDDGIVIHEADLVTPNLTGNQRAFGCPSTRIAESLGRIIVQNIVMLGFFTGVTQLISRKEMREAVMASVPPGTEDLNLKAFDTGLKYYDEHYGDVKEEVKEVPVSTE